MWGVDGRTDRRRRARAGWWLAAAADGWNKISAKRQQHVAREGGRQRMAAVQLPFDNRFNRFARRGCGVLNARPPWPDGVDLHSSDPTPRSFISVGGRRSV